MLRRCLLTVPGLDVRTDWRIVRGRLLDDFPALTEVLATTTPETLLVLHEGPPDTTWIDTVTATLARADPHRTRPGRGAPANRTASLRWGIVSGWW